MMSGALRFRNVAPDAVDVDESPAELIITRPALAQTGGGAL